MEDKPADNKHHHWGQFIIFLCSLFLYCQASFASVYYVDASRGLDLNEGTQKKPWKSIQKINSQTFLPGDSILFKRGEIWNEMLIIPSSGEPGKPIVFGAYGQGEPPLIDGSVSLQDNWLTMGNNVYSRPWKKKPGVLFFKNRPYPAILTLTLSPQVKNVPQAGAIILQVKPGSPYTNGWVVGSDPSSKRISLITSFEEKWDTSRPLLIRQLNAVSQKEEKWPKMLPPAEVSPKLSSLTRPGYWNWHDGTLSLHSDIHPAQANVRCSQLNYGIHTNSKQHITVRDLAIRGTNKAGVLVGGTNHALIENIQVFGTGSQQPRSAIILKNSNHNRVTNNKIESVIGIGIAIYADRTSSSNNTVSHNQIIKTGGSGILLGGEHEFRINNNLVADNTVEYANRLHYDSAGIYTYFCGEGNKIIGNTVINGGSETLKSSGIMLDTKSGPILVEGNHIENNSHGGIVVTGKGHDIKNNTLIRNSSPQWNDAEFMFFTVNEGAANCIVKDNTLRADEDKNFVKMSKGNTKGHQFNNNKYQGGSPSPFYWKETWLTFKDWQRKSTLDKQSTYNINQ